MKIIFFVFFYLPYKIAFFFWLIYFNIISLIPHLYMEGFMNFTSLIYDLVIFKRNYKKLIRIFIRTIILFSSLFSFLFFSIVNIFRKKAGNNNIYITLYYLSSFSLFFSFFIIQLYFNFIFFITIFVKEKFRLRHITESFNRKYFKYTLDLE